MRDPAFWWTEHSTAATLLAPIGVAYGAIAARHMARQGRKAAVPVICVGNFTLGGAGKTPTAIALARLLLASGHRPFFLSRGYGGHVAGPVRIDQLHLGFPGARDRASMCPPVPPSGATAPGLVAEPAPKPDTTLIPDPSPQREGEKEEGTIPCGYLTLARDGRLGDVGDEPLLLARVAPVIVARDRLAGAKLAVEGGADTIIMDDGLQNPSLHKDLAIAVVDGRRGIGNGRPFPAGPLRAPLEAQFNHIDAVLVVGSAGCAAQHAMEIARRRGTPVFRGDLHPSPEAVAELAGKPVLAFAGIADPDKFFATLEAHGIAAAVRKRFPDHHRYAVDEISALLTCAQQNGLTPVTTEKDLARLSRDPAAIELIARSATLPVTLRFRQAPAVEAMLRAALRRRGVAAAG
jgi:tetraacyldisaccharide 4'-kinase